jgi:hypothetical protein
MNLPSLSDMKLYFSNKSALIRIICRTKQWSGVKESDISDWIHFNFPDDIGKYLAVKILLHSLYYSEDNVIALLEHGIYNEILGEEAKASFVSGKNIYILPASAEGEIKVKIAKTLFVPLLDGNKPSESGNSIARCLTTKLQIPSENISFHFLLDPSQLSSYERVIIVDDCIGSGSQLDKFWNESFENLRNEVLKLGIDVYYLSLIGYADQVFQLQLAGALQGLKIVICDRLEEHNRTFSISNILWNNSSEELDMAINYFNEIEKKFGVPRLGYNGYDFSVFIHNSVPDWSLPIFWMENSDWKPLLKRKNSNF